MKPIQKLVTIVAATVLAQLVIMNAGASAERPEPINLSMIRHLRSEPLMRIEGTLSCEGSMTPAGQGCLLKLREANTGRNFHLSQADRAMELFQAGKTRVAIEGKMRSEDTVEVRSAETL